VRSFTLTAAGRNLFEAVSGPIDALETALTELSQDSREPRGLVRLTAPPDLGRMVLSDMLVAFLQRYPEIQLELSFSNRFVDLVQEGFDVAVRAGRVVGNDLIARKLCDAELHLAAAAGHPGFESPKQLERAPFVLHSSQGVAAGVQVLRLERRGKRAQSAEISVSGPVQADDFASVVEFVARRQGVGLLPAMHVREGVSAGRLIQILPEWFSRAPPVHLVTPGRRQPERVRVLAEWLREAFAHLRHV
jgi:DNA-binding transcriptional LysR family regulator